MVLALISLGGRVESCPHMLNSREVRAFVNWVARGDQSLAPDRLHEQENDMHVPTDKFIAHFTSFLLSQIVEQFELNS